MTFAFAGNELSIPGFCFGVGRGLFLNGNAGVGAERVVDHTAAAVVAFVDGVSEGRPGIEEVARVKERTVVAVVGAAGVTGDDVGAPSHAVELIAVAVGADGAENVRAVGVIDIELPVARDVICVASLVVTFELFEGTLRIAVASGGVFTLDVSGGETVAGKIRVLLKKSTGVHHADSNGPAVEAQSVRIGGAHGFKTPVLLVFGSLPGGNGSLNGFSGGVLGEEAGSHVCGGGAAGSKHEGGNGKSDGALRGLALGCMMFVGHDVLLMSCAPLCLEDSIHLVSPKKMVVAGPDVNWPQICVARHGKNT